MLNTVLNRLRNFCAPADVGYSAIAIFGIATLLTGANLANYPIFFLGSLVAVAGASKMWPPV